jgi:membrane-bound lytic murein transglycosylase A
MLSQLLVDPNNSEFDFAMEYDTQRSSRCSAERPSMPARKIHSSRIAFAGSETNPHSFPLRRPNWTCPAFVPLRGLLLVVPAVAMFALPETTKAQHYSSSPPRHSNTQSTAPVSGAKETGAVDPAPGPLRIPNAAVEPITWGDLDGWAGDDHASAFATFYTSCRPIVRASALRAEVAQIHPVRDRSVRTQLVVGARKRPARNEADARKRPARPAPLRSPPESRPIRSALEQVCARAVTAGRLDPRSAREFFEENFVPVRIRKLGDSAGFLTGYYEPIVDGSRVPTPEFPFPLYRRPRDLVAPGVAAGAPFPNTGRAFRQTPNGELVPYYDRGEIEDGALDGQHLEICWLRSAADALTIQIEGSARVRLEDGTFLRLSYDAHNGYPFVPISRVLTERRLLTREEMSLQRIREWVHDNPDAAKTIRRQNRQVVFFRVVGLNDDTEAIGAQGIPLTAGRSIAVDKALHPYGTPFFIEAELPGPSGQSSFRRLMIAQDTGSAIVGPARADLFFGAGEEAGKLAGRIQQTGRFAILVPRELGQSIMTASIPLPPERPGPMLASYGFRPVSLPTKPESSPDSTPVPRPAAPRPAALPARSEPSQFAARALRPGALHPPEPSREPPRFAVPTRAEASPPAKPMASHVAARAHRSDTPIATKPVASKFRARTLQPAALAQAKIGKSEVATGVRQPATNPVLEDARRRATR